MVYRLADLGGRISAILYGKWVSISCWAHIYNIERYMGKHILLGANLLWVSNRVRCISTILYGIWLSISCWALICYIVCYTGKHILFSAYLLYCMEYG